MTQDKYRTHSRLSPALTIVLPSREQTRRTINTISPAPERRRCLVGARVAFSSTERRGYVSVCMDIITASRCGVHQHHSGAVSAGATPMFGAVPPDLAVRKRTPLPQAPVAHQQRYPISNADRNPCQGSFLTQIKTLVKGSAGKRLPRSRTTHHCCKSRPSQAFSSVARAASPLLCLSPHRAPA